MKSKKVAIIGASGYSGEELVRLLLNHPHVELVAVTSRQNAGQTLAQVFPKFASHPKSKTLRFTEPNAELLAKQADVVFLALPHGVAAEYAVPLLDAGCVVIDLSADFRLKSAEIYKEFYAHDHPAPELLKKSVYGLPEIYREQIKKALLIASPGCYPTSILLPVDSVAEGGVDQTGRHHRRFVERRERRGPQGRGGLSFLRMQRKRPALRRAQTPAFVGNRGTTFAGGRDEGHHPVHAASDSGEPRHFDDALPHAGTLSTGGNAVDSEKISACYRKAYGNEPFVRLLEGKALPDTKNVVGTNVIEIAWRLDPRTGRLIVMSAEDNLVKGASGQAVQSMNLLCGFPETAGLV